LHSGLRSSQAFTVRRCQILLASARGQTASEIAEAVGCSAQAVRNVLRAFEQRGIESLRMQSRRPKSATKVFDAARSEHLRALLHQSPRDFGKPTSVWTLELAAEVCFERGLTPSRVSDETVRDAINRLGLGWKRAKNWITSPDPEYARKKNGAIG
jgi:transposase